LRDEHVLRVDLQLLELELLDELADSAVLVIYLSYEGLCVFLECVDLPALLFCFVLKFANKNIQISNLFVFVFDLLFTELICLLLPILLRLLKLGLEFIDFFNGLLQLLIVVVLHRLSQVLELVCELLLLPLLLLFLFPLLALFLVLLLCLLSFSLSLLILCLGLGF